MNARERILSIRLIEKIYAVPAYTKQLGIEAAILYPKGSAATERKEQS